MDHAAKVSREPNPSVAILCCVRSQREKCCMSEKFCAAAQRFNWPFVDVAASIRRRIYKMRTKLTCATKAIPDAAFFLRVHYDKHCGAA